MEGKLMEHQQSMLKKLDQCLKKDFDTNRTF